MSSQASSAATIPREGCSFMHTVDDLLIDVLGKWCSRCRKMTQPYVGEGEPLGYGAYADVWPCCDGCWKVYPDA